MSRRRLAAAALLAASTAPLLASAPSPQQRFRQAADLARSGDYPRALDAYRELAGNRQESASLYWNWAQTAAVRGAQGEALWALLRARELSPGDSAVAREIARLREGLNLDPAEIAPEPLAGLGRFCRRFHLGAFGLVAAALSLALHLLARLAPTGRWPLAAAGASLTVGLLLAALPLLAARARPTAVVIRRGAPLLEAASATAQPLASLREGEVVPVLDESQGFLRLEDSSGARGWTAVEDLRRLDRPPER